MKNKSNIKQRTQTIQGLRSFKDTLPKNIRKIINKRGHVFSETLNNWKYIVDDDLFKVCYPKSFKSSNIYSSSCLVIMVKRGHEIDMEYSKKKIIDKMNAFFGYQVIEKVKFLSFDDSQSIFKKYKEKKIKTENYNDYKKINNIKKLIKLTNFLKKK